MMHYHFYILDNHHQIKESLRLEENTNIIKINNLDKSKKEWILSRLLKKQGVFKETYKSKLKREKIQI